VIDVRAPKTELQLVQLLVESAPAKEQEPAP